MSYADSEVLAPEVPKSSNGHEQLGALQLAAEAVPKTRTKPKKPPAQTLQKLVREKLRESGISDALAKRLHLKVLTAAEAKRLGYQELGGFLIPYPSLTGTFPAGRFERLRYMEKPTGFNASLPFHKYGQKAGTLNDVYLPPLTTGTWAKLLGDASKPLIITEGELKAICATCVYNTPTLGLGGVSMISAKKRGIEFLATLAKAVWSGRTVFVAFDSDAAEKPAVVQAQCALARELANRGALVRIVTLPPKADGGKQGLDDFLQAHGPKGLEKILNASTEWAASTALWEMNAEIVLVRKLGAVVERSTHALFPAKEAVGTTFANMTHTEAVGDKFKVVGTAPTWLKWRHRSEVFDVGYEPGQTEIVTAGNVRLFNLWRRFGVEPKPGNVDPWHAVMDDRIFWRASSDPATSKDMQERRWWLECWFAFPLQHSGAKLYTSSLLWSRGHGVCKSLVGEMLSSIHGDKGNMSPYEPNSVTIGSRDLEDKYLTGMVARKTLIIGEEIVGSKRFANKETMKDLITRRYLLVDDKWVKRFQLRNTANFFLLSQSDTAIAIEDEDRRYFVHNVTP